MTENMSEHPLFSDLALEHAPTNAPTDPPVTPPKTLAAHQHILKRTPVHHDVAHTSLGHKEAPYKNRLDSGMRTYWTQVTVDEFGATHGPPGNDLDPGRVEELGKKLKTKLTGTSKPKKEEIERTATPEPAPARGGLGSLLGGWWGRK